MPFTSPTPPITPSLLTVDDVARALGVAKITVTRMVKGGELPALRIPGRRTLRIPLSSFQEWILSNTRIAPVVLAPSDLR